MTSRAAAAQAQALEIEFHDGRMAALPTAKTGTARKAPAKKPEQGSLF